MANVKKGNLTPSPQWWKHLKDFKRVFWKSERKAQDEQIKSQAEEAWRIRGISRKPTLDKFGDTVWPQDIDNDLD